MGEKLHLTGNAVLVDTYAQRTAQRLAVAVDAVRAEFRKIKAQDYRSPRARDNRPQPAASEVPTQQETPPSKSDLRFIEVLCRASHEHIDWLQRHLDPAWIAHETTRLLTRVFLRHYSEDGSLTPVLAAVSEHPSALQIITQSASNQRLIPDIQGEFVIYARTVRDAWIDRRTREITERFRSIDSANLAVNPEAQDLNREKYQLKALKKSPLTPLSDA